MKMAKKKSSFQITKIFWTVNFLTFYYLLYVTSLKVDPKGNARWGGGTIFLDGPLKT